MSQSCFKWGSHTQGALKNFITRLFPDPPFILNTLNLHFLRNSIQLEYKIFVLQKTYPFKKKCLKILM